MSDHASHVSVERHRSGHEDRADPGSTRDPRAVGARFLPGLALLPTFAAVSTIVLYLAGWPEPDDGGAVIGVGLGIAVLGWLVVSVLFFGPLTRVESAAGDTYDQLRTRVLSLRARVDAHRSAPPDAGAPGGSALAEAALIVADLEREMAPAGPASQKWLLGTGYVNLWRRVHRAEEALLELAPRDELYGVALHDRALLGRLRVDGAQDLRDALTGILGTPDGAAAPAARETAIALLDMPDARALVRQARYTAHAYRGDLWDKLVNLRNRLVATMFLTTLGTYGLLAVAVLQEADADAVAGAVALYLVGAGVGLFRELYATANRRAGMVFDYGLGYVRLLAIPVLSGIAAIGGVAIVALGGVPADDGTVPLSDVYSLDTHPYGLIVAAIFGLTPNLLLERLRSRTDQYQQEIQPRGGVPDGTPR